MATKTKIFFNPNCPYCHMALDFFKTVLPDEKLEKIELGENETKKSRDMFFKTLDKCGFESRGIPLVVANGECFQGFDENIGKQIKRTLGRK